MGERWFFLKRPQGAHWSAEAGNPPPKRCENSSLAENLQRVTGKLSPGTTRTRPRSSRGAPPREKVTPVWNINQQVCARGQSSAHFYFFTCFLQLAGNVWSSGGLVWLRFSVHSGLLTYTVQWSSWYFDAGKMLLIHSSGGVRARMTPTSLCMICAANHIMRFPDWPSILFSQLCKEPLFGKYCMSERPDNSLYRAHAQWGLRKPRFILG